VIVSLALYLSCLLLIVLAMFGAFARRSRKELFVTVFGAIFAITISFAGVYYAFSAIGDYSDAVDKYYYYKWASVDVRMGSLTPQEVTPFEGSRAFDGIRARLWSGVDCSSGDRSRLPSVIRQMT
jgi:hypothetical protein